MTWFLRESLQEGKLLLDTDCRGIDGRFRFDQGDEMELFNWIFVFDMRLGSKEEETSLDSKHTGIHLQIGHSEAIKPCSTVNLIVLEAIDTQLNQQVLVEVSRVQ